MPSNAQEQLKSPADFQHTIYLLKMVIVLSGINFLLFALLLDGPEVYEVVFTGVYVPALLFRLANFI